MAKPTAPKSPLLTSLSIPKPCSQSWGAMAGDNRKRFCGECQKTVHDLSALTQAEAESLVQTVGSDGHLPCVQFYRRADGTVLTADSPRVERVFVKVRQRMPSWMAAAVAFALGLLGPARYAQGNEPEGFKLGEMAEATTATVSPAPSRGHMLRGKVAAPRPKPTPKPTPKSAPNPESRENPKE